MYRFVIILLVASLLSALVPFDITPVQAAGTTIDMATSSKWNIRFDGSAASSNLGLDAITTADLNGDGALDVIVADRNASPNGTDRAGSLYVIYNSLFSSLTGTGNTIDLSSSSNYNLRFDGSLSGSGGGLGREIRVADADGDGKQDIFFATLNGATSGAGAIYMISGDLIDDYTGTGNNINLATTSNFSIRWDGVNALDSLGYAVIVKDIDNNGRVDLLMGTPFTDFNSRTSSGSVYIVKDSLIRGYSGTGNVVPLSTTSNFSMRYDGAAASVQLSNQSANFADMDNNGKVDLLIGSATTSFSGSNAGSIYIIKDDLLDDYTGTGNLVDLATSTNWSIRIDGASASDAITYLGRLDPKDIDGDEKLDLVFGSGILGSGANGRSGSGSAWVVYNTIFSSYTGTGNVIPLSNSNHWNLRFDGAAASDLFGYAAIASEDIDNDGRLDLLIPAQNADPNSRSNAGSTYVILSDLIDDYGGSTGNTFDMADSTKYSLRYDGAVAGDNLGYTNIHVIDLDGDGAKDLLFGSYLADNNSRTNSGSVYVIYNFPHTLSVNESRIDTSNTNPHITGSLTASNSSTTIGDVQYSLSNASPTASSWTSCTASDGSFNSTNESFTCALSFSSDATHNVFIRAKDSNGSYTPARRYGSLPLTVDRLALPTLSITAQQYSNDGSVTVNGTYNDDRSGLDNIQVKGIGSKSVTAGLNGASWSVTYANVPDGVYQLSAISYDRAGNEKIVTAGNTTTVDRAAPTLTASATNLTDKDNSSTVEQGVTIEGSVADGYAGLKSIVLVNETTNSTIPLKIESNGSYKTDVTLRKGQNSIKVTAVDYAGNTATKTLTITRTSFISSTSKDIPITDEKGITKKYKQSEVLAGLKPGKTNIFVRSLQDSLKTLGHFSSNVTGFFGDLTKKAVLAFQKASGIKQTGTVRTQTLARFDGAVTNPNYLAAIASSKAGLSQKELTEAVTYQLKKDIQAGKQDEEIKFVQKKLYVLGYYTGSINGWLNTSTQQAINEYRVDKGLSKGGVDVRLRKALNSL